MLDKNDRIIIEAIRNASKIKIVIENKGEESQINFSPSKILCHDIAIAVQSHYNRVKNDSIRRSVLYGKPSKSSFTL